MATLRCKAHGCARLLGEFESDNPNAEYCPECADRIGNATRPTLYDCEDWIHVNGGRMRRNHIGGAGR